LKKLSVRTVSNSVDVEVPAAPPATRPTTRPYLGVNLQAVDATLAKSFKLPSAEGALVTHVVAGSPAAEAGVKEDDFIVSINGETVRKVEDAVKVLAKARAGDEIALELYRDGAKRTVKVQTEDMAAMVWRPRFATADAMVRSLQETFKDQSGFSAAASADARALVVRAPPVLFEQIKALVAKLDVPPATQPATRPATAPASG
jgi:type II secretory pathway component GspD/PulD (secretin)